MCVHRETLKRIGKLRSSGEEEEEEDQERLEHIGAGSEECDINFSL